MRLKIAVLCMVGVASAIAQTASTDDSSKAVVYVYRLQGGSGPPLTLLPSTATNRS